MAYMKLLLLFAASISARAISSRATPAQILSDLQGIDSSTNSLTTTVRNWDGSLLGSLGVNGASNDLGNQIDAANNDARGSPVSSSADSQRIIAYINGTLEPDIATSLAAIDARKADFARDGEQSLVLSTLNSLRNKTDSYSTTLEGIASSDQKTNAAAVAAKIDSDFAAAIAFFSS